jgi:hypothetical protein
MAGKMEPMRCARARVSTQPQMNTDEHRYGWERTILGGGGPVNLCRFVFRCNRLPHLKG